MDQTLIKTDFIYILNLSVLLKCYKIVRTLSR